ncbi:hypothetical protein G5714_019197 [Onychostoma macrolepis]|uniref:Dynamin N-terminal domain-containing protein n=1 Tax=Onychostoma macrolepis TaxID=369639 RepID=A0A7J6C1R9_9TELE|nr:hypothetical protein G5714_019197 [Onychostoma macrolepis]
MEAFHGMKKNTPSLLPVPSPRTSSDGLSIDPTMVSQDMEAMENAKQIMKRLTKNLNSDIISKLDQADTFSRKKATIGIFGRSGEGKSSLLNAILGKQDLLPSGCFGACTAVVTQVEANLTDSNYTAEIELISKEEWEEDLKYLSRDIKDKSEDSNKDLKEVAVEKITALYGSDADKKTPEELKKDIKFAEIKTFLSVSKMVISKNDLSEFINDVASFIQHNESSTGGWFWPLVKSVTIKIPGCHELLEHIVLLDLPGTGDYNKIREDLWKSCSSVWIVSDINRAITDRDPWGILKHCIQELGPGGECKSINFICTKTDDINTRMYMSVTGKTGKSVQEQIDKFSVIQSDSAYPSSDNLHHIHNFIKIEETKLKSELKRHIVNIKKDIYSSIQTTIQNKMASSAAESGKESLKRMQDLLIITVEEIKEDMFNEAKEEVLKKFNNLKLYIKDALESRLKRSMDLSLSQTCKITWTDVSSEIEQLERLSEQLSD